MSGFGPNALNIEGSLRNAVRQHGLARDLIVDLATVTDRNGLSLTSGTRPEMAEPSGMTGWRGIKWDHDDTATHKILVAFQMPSEWAELEGGLIVELVARKIDATDENADLALYVNASWFTPGTAVNTVAGAFTSETDGDSSTTTLTTTALAVLAPSAAAAISEFRTYKADIGYRLSAESKRIDPGDMVLLEIYPHETVGSADMDLELIGIRIRMALHATVEPANRFT